ncbi:TonB-dependent siderophore receptor [Vandammella animalimorsus]|uniref:TonB-dependent siderophore receptor n=1 Tax=Vandammella animalimorsus TaxID=2029117 RepID=UPI0031BAAAF3
MARRAISIAFPPVISALIPAAGPTAIAATLATGRPRRLTPAAIQAWARPHGLRPSALALAAFATASLAAGGALLSARSAQAQTAAAITTATQATTPATRHYHLPAGPLGASLAAFAGQAGLLLSFDPALTQGRQAPALQGRHSPQSGLAELLAGSGLQAEQQADGSFTLRRAPAPARAAGASAQTLPAVTVQAAPETATGPVTGYAARRSATATKTDTPLVETPQSVSVMGRDEFEDRGARSVMEAVRYTPGVVSHVYGAYTRGQDDWINLRGFGGFGTALYQDGLRMNADAGGFASQRSEPFGLERVEVLRGPASVLYGKGDAGGMVNRVSKRPRADAVRELEVQLGNHRRRQMAADVGGPLNAQGTLRYRLIGLGMAENAQDRYANGYHVNDKRLYLAPSLTWQPSADTSLTLLSEFIHDRNRGFAFTYTPLQAPQRRASAFLLGEPAFTGFKHRQAAIGYQFEHRFSPVWSLHQSARLSRVAVHYPRINAGALGDDGYTLARRVHVFDETNRQINLDTHLQGKLRTGSVAHTLLLGLDMERQTLDALAASGRAAPLDIRRPLYGQPVSVSPEADWNNTRQRLRQTGLYAQDQMRLSSQWLLTVGGRMDWARLHSDDFLENTSQRQRDRQFSGRVGLNWLLPSGWTPYASYAESFLPTVGRDAHGNTFKPTRGKLFELGVKYAPEGGRQLFTAALYDLRKTHVLTTDPDNPDHSKQTGAIRARGIELEAKAALSRQWEMLANYTYNNIRVRRSNDGDVGKVPVHTPRQTASVWLQWRAPQGRLSGLGAGLGVRHVGSNFNDAANTWKNPSATFIDAALTYDRGPWRFGLNVTNLGNKEQRTSCFELDGGNLCGYAQVRTVVLSAKYRF